MKQEDFLGWMNQAAIVDAIKKAEGKTSGEIRVFVTRQAVYHPLGEGRRVFEKIGMMETKKRNGVLFFIAPKTRRFSVIFDVGVEKKCGSSFWHQVTNEMSYYFEKDAYTFALVAGIKLAGKILADHFPSCPEDKNELPNLIATD